MKIAIIGAGVGGLACAQECERLGVVPDIYERDNSVGWMWPSVIFWPSVFSVEQGDMRKYLLENFNIDIRPLTQTKTLIMKSHNKEVKIEGKLGYFLARGKSGRSFENQLLRDLNRTRIQYNTPVDCKELAKKYDFVVVSSGRIADAIELDV